MLSDANKAFLAPLLRVDPVSTFSGDAKKHEQAFLAPLAGKALVKKNLVGHVHGNVYVW
jgi:hypothetical protein